MSKWEQIGTKIDDLIDMSEKGDAGAVQAMAQLEQFLSTPQMTASIEQIKIRRRKALVSEARTKISQVVQSPVAVAGESVEPFNTIIGYCEEIKDYIDPTGGN